ncbi:hypothetical protein HK102_008393 [Quaeritorhiza haematococci]|nr:hypothetical protein HK102_008393 [Quaeritorhiza haematococci]
MLRPNTLLAFFAWCCCAFAFISPPAAFAQQAKPKKYPDAQFVYPLYPYASTVWREGERSLIEWHAYVDDITIGITRLVIELATGQGTTVERLEVIESNITFPTVTSIFYSFPTGSGYRVPGSYALVFTGTNEVGDEFGPQFSTWFNVMPGNGTTTGNTPASAPSGASAGREAGRGGASSNNLGSNSANGGSAATFSSNSNSSPSTANSKNSGSTRIPLSVWWMGALAGALALISF